MFGGKFHEGFKPGCQHLTTAPLPEDNVNAMLLLLSITHGPAKRVPQNQYTYVHLVVILIDKYEFHEVEIKSALKLAKTNQRLS